MRHIAQGVHRPESEPRDDPFSRASVVGETLLSVHSDQRVRHEGAVMARGRQPGVKNRNYPPVPLKEAARVAQTIQDDASGVEVTRLTLAELMDTTPTSGKFKDLVAASRFYGLTNGGVNATDFSLTELGRRATGGDEVAQVVALKEAVMNVPPYKSFFETFNSKKVPSTAPLKDFLVKSADVDPDKTDEVIEYILSDAATAGLTRPMKGGADWVDLSGTPSPASVVDQGSMPTEDGAPEDEGESNGPTAGSGDGGAEATSSRTDRNSVHQAGVGKKVFIAHGKNRTPLDQLKKALDQFKVKYAVAVDEANRGRPISKKVAELMESDCSSGIFIFTADERFLREKDDGTTEEVWRPSENVVYELGAASILYDNRIVIFKEKGVSFPSDFSDLGYIEFDKDQLVAELGALFTELVGLDILEVRAKG